MRNLRSSASEKVETRRYTNLKEGTLKTAYKSVKKDSDKERRLRSDIHSSLWGLMIIVT